MIGAVKELSFRITGMTNKSPTPNYLETFELLQQHIRGQLEGLTTTEKGKRFARFVQRLVPQADAGAGFEMPELNNKLSNDGGVDLIGQDKKNDRTLYIQSKLYVDRADSIDSVLSKFQAFKARDKTKRKISLNFCFCYKVFLKRALLNLSLFFQIPLILISLRGFIGKIHYLIGHFLVFCLYAELLTLILLIEIQI
ncbi:MAG: hypothetical protein V7L05_23025 [Nostoc sp.]